MLWFKHILFRLDYAFVVITTNSCKGQWLMLSYLISSYLILVTQYNGLFILTLVMDTEARVCDPGATAKPRSLINGNSSWACRSIWKKSSVFFTDSILSKCLQRYYLLYCHPLNWCQHSGLMRQSELITIFTQPSYSFAAFLASCRLCLFTQSRRATRSQRLKHG